MQIMYKVNGRLFESEKEAKEYENSERIALISKINQMKDSVLPKYYKRTVIAKENFLLIFRISKKMSKKSIVENAKEINDIIQEVAKSKIALEIKICEYKKMREQLKKM